MPLEGASGHEVDVDSLDRGVVVESVLSKLSTDTTVRSERRKS